MKIFSKMKDGESIDAVINIQISGNVRQIVFQAFGWRLYVFVIPVLKSCGSYARKDGRFYKIFSFAV